MVNITALFPVLLASTSLTKTCPDHYRSGVTIGTTTVFTTHTVIVAPNGATLTPTSLPTASTASASRIGADHHHHKSTSPTKFSSGSKPSTTKCTNGRKIDTDKATYQAHCNVRYSAVVIARLANETLPECLDACSVTYPNCRYAAYNGSSCLILGRPRSGPRLEAGYDAYIKTSAPYAANSTIGGQSSAAPYPTSGGYQSMTMTMSSNLSLTLSGASMMTTSPLSQTTAFRSNLTTA